MEGVLRWILVALAMAALTVSASAQGAGGNNQGMSTKMRNLRPDQKPEDASRRKADDAKYKASLGNMPNRSFDPWKSVR